MESVENKISRINKILIISLIAFLILSLVLMFFLLKDKVQIDITKLFKVQAEDSISLDEFIVNINNDNGRKGYLKLELALMYTNKKGGKLIEANINKIRDIVITNLMQKSSSDFSSVEGISEFKDEIKSKINGDIHGDLVQDVYITNIVIQ